MMRKKTDFRKRLYCSMVAILSLFAVGSNNLYAANNSGSGGILIGANASQHNAQEVKVGEKAPDFTFMKDGESVKLSDYLNARIVMVKFSSTSAESRKIDADFAGIKERYKNVDIIFVDLSLDRDADVAAAYGISSAPAICIIDPDGLIYSIDYGNVDLDKKMKDLFP